jgi:hypothetical protein
VALSFLYAARRAAAGLGSACLAAVFATLALTALLYAMQSLPRASITAHIRSSFTHGALQEHDWLLKDDRLGVNQYAQFIAVCSPSIRAETLSYAGSFSSS